MAIAEMEREISYTKPNVKSTKLKPNNLFKQKLTI
jgi:hypothetical protein